MNTGVGETDMERPRSEAATDSTKMEVMLVLFEGMGSTRVEFVTVVEFRITVP